MGAFEISYLMELNKRKAEAEFKKNYLISKGRSKEDRQLMSIEEELATVSKQAIELESKITTKEIVFYPNERKIAQLNLELSKYKPDEVMAAMDSRLGDAYTILEKRGKFLKENYEKRRDVAALVEFVNSLPSKTREEITERARNGEVDTLDVSTLDEKSREKLFRLLNRVGIVCFSEGHTLTTKPKKGGAVWEEIRVEGADGYVWAEPKEAENVKEFLKQLVAIGNKIQILTAERQVRKFSADEETQFLELQKSYLEMIRKRNALLSC